MNGIVYLVGAGCGEADLITVRGMQLLQSCDAVVYDDLIDTRLLELIPPAAEKIYMGKRRGAHSAEQSEINGMLISLAGSGKRVVRLKGGDPFVFGRAGEEILALREAGIAYETVPGVSSCIAVPARAGIPVTHRGISRGFHVITAHTRGADGELAGMLKKLADTDGTLVILMGFRKLREIADCLLQAGMAQETPAAVISGSDISAPPVVRAPLSDIADRTEQMQLQPPAVIVIGEAAAMDLRPEPLPLSGIRIGVTGTDVIRNKLIPGLSALGASVYTAERSALKRLPVRPELLTALCDGKPRRIVFTSASGVRIFFSLLMENGIDIRRLAACSFAVIGKATGQALKSFGVLPELCPETYTAADLGEELLRTGIPGDEIWLFRSARGSRALTEALSSKFEVHDVPTYDMEPDPATCRNAEKLLPETDYLTFSSGSGAELFFELYGAVPDRARCVCIGAVTAAELEKYTDKEYLLAPEISAEGIIQAVLEDAAAREARH